MQELNHSSAFTNISFISDFEYHKSLKKEKAKDKSFAFWVNDGARTHDPRYHKPML